MNEFILRPGQNVNCNIYMKFSFLGSGLFEEFDTHELKKLGSSGPYLAGALLRFGGLDPRP